MNQRDQQLMTINEFCDIFCISRTTAYKEIKLNRLNILKVGKKTLISADAAQAWIDLLEEERVSRRQAIENAAVKAIKELAGVQ